MLDLENEKDRQKKTRFTPLQMYLPSSFGIHTLDSFN